MSCKPASQEVKKTLKKKGVSHEKQFFYNRDKDGRLPVYLLTHALCL
jgi:hypothetical protein